MIYTFDEVCGKRLASFATFEDALHFALEMYEDEPEKYTPEDYMITAWQCINPFAFDKNDGYAEAWNYDYSDEVEALEAAKNE
jgi:hypothetical protein